MKLVVRRTDGVGELSRAVGDVARKNSERNATERSRGNDMSDLLLAHRRHVVIVDCQQNVTNPTTPRAVSYAHVVFILSFRMTRPRQTRQIDVVQIITVIYPSCIFVQMCICIL